MISAVYEQISPPLSSVLQRLQSDVQILLACVMDIFISSVLQSTLSYFWRTLLLHILLVDCNNTASTVKAKGESSLLLAFVWQLV